MEGQGGVETIAIVGTGRVGTALAHLLSSRGRRVVAVADIHQGARERAAGLSGAAAFELGSEAARGADVILITTHDGAIEPACVQIAGSGVPLEGKKVVHMSGALSLGALGSARERGARTICIHPIQTFADLEGAQSSLPGSTFGVTCSPEDEAWARAFVETLDGKVLMVADRDKVLYHAAAAIACNLLAMVEYGAFVITRGIGFDDGQVAEALTTLARATVENVGRLGPAGALTGPLARGDTGTLKAHLASLESFAPELAAMYRAVSLWGLRCAREGGRPGERALDEMEKLLRED